MSDFGGIWGSLSLLWGLPGASQEFLELDEIGEAFPAKSTFLFFWLFFVFPGFLFPSGNVFREFCWEEADSKLLEFPEVPGQDRQTFPREQEEEKSREKAGKDEEKRRKKGKIFLKEKWERFGIFPSSFPAAPFPQDRGPSLLQIPNFPSGKAPWTLALRFPEFPEFPVNNFPLSL